MTTLSAAARASFAMKGTQLGLRPAFSGNLELPVAFGTIHFRLPGKYKVKRPVPLNIPFERPGAVEIQFRTRVLARETLHIFRVRCDEVCCALYVGKTRWKRRRTRRRRTRIRRRRRRRKRRYRVCIGYVSFILSNRFVAFSLPSRLHGKECRADRWQGIAFSPFQNSEW